MTGKNWNASDLDIHVPGDWRGWVVSPAENVDDWKEIQDNMQLLGFKWVDLHEHAFSKDSYRTDKNNHKDLDKINYLEEWLNK